MTPLAELEKQAILSTIRQLNGDKLLAARLLGIGKTTLYRKLKEYGIEEVMSTCIRRLVITAIASGISIHAKKLILYEKEQEFSIESAYLDDHRV